MNPTEQAEIEEELELRRFHRFEQLWRDITAAEREAQATARLDVALNTCCPDVDRRASAAPTRAGR